MYQLSLKYFNLVLIETHRPRLVSIHIVIARMLVLSCFSSHLSLTAQ